MHRRRARARRLRTASDRTRAPGLQELTPAVQLGIPIGAEILFLDRFEASNLDPRFHGPAWRRVPGHSSSSGRAIAAFNPAVQRAIFQAGLTRRTLHRGYPRQLSEILGQVRRRGYAATDEELEEGISSVAAPVCVTDELGPRAIAAVAVVGPSPRLHRDGIATVARHAMQAADQIGHAMSALGA
jgi:IclR family KDG regulon transcriptional repressor